MYHSHGEFQVKLDDLLMQVDRLCDERSNDAGLAGAQRSLQLSSVKFRRKEKLGPLERQRLAQALETVRAALAGDDRFADQIWDIEDFVDANLVEST